MRSLGVLKSGGGGDLVAKAREPSPLSECSASLLTIWPPSDGLIFLEPRTVGRGSEITRGD